MKYPATKYYHEETVSEMIVCPYCDEPSLLYEYGMSVKPLPEYGEEYECSGCGKTSIIENEEWTSI